MNALKLAVVSPFPPSMGTLNEYGFHLVNQFMQKEEVSRIDILSDELPDNESYDSLDLPEHVHVHSSWAFNSPKNIFRIIRKLKSLKPDVVFFNVHFLSFGDKKIAAALGLIIPFLCRMLGMPSVVLLHNITENVDLKDAGITANPVLTAIYKLSGTILTRFLLGANVLAVTIEQYVDILEKKYGAKNVVLIPHGTFDNLEQVPVKPGSDKLNVMTFGKFGTYKRVEVLIEAIELIRSRTNLDVELVVAGSDSPNKKGYLAEMERKYSHVADLRFTGYVPEEEVPVIFTNSDVVVFPYTSTTGSSGVLHQAGSFGRAAVLPRIGDLHLLIEKEGFGGAYYAPDSVEELADALQDLLLDEDKRNTLGEQNFAAANALPLSDIADWYLGHMMGLKKNKSKVENGLPETTVSKLELIQA